jgi:hypothetical protein
VGAKQAVGRPNQVRKGGRNRRPTDGDDEIGWRGDSRKERTQCGASAPTPAVPLYRATELQGSAHGDARVIHGVARGNDDEMAISASLALVTDTLHVARAPKTRGAHPRY